MPELIPDTRVEGAKTLGPCTGQVMVVVAQEMNKAKCLAERKRMQGSRSIATAAWRMLLLLPFAAGALGLIVFGLIPILVLALVLFLPAVLPLLIVSAGILATENKHEASSGC